MSSGLQPRWPDVYAALLALLPTVLTFTGGPRGPVQIYDGQYIGGDVPVDFVTVGFQSDDGSGSFAQAWDPSGFGTIETGDIRCLFSADSGDSDPIAVAADRARVFAMFGSLQSSLMSDQTLGGALSGFVLTLSAQVVAIENAAGAATSLLVVLAYQVTTYFT